MAARHDGFVNAGNYAAETTVIRTDAEAVAWIARLRALIGRWIEAQLRRQDRK